jgi:hypothetical protein
VNIPHDLQLRRNVAGERRACVLSHVASHSGTSRSLVVCDKILARSRNVFLFFLTLPFQRYKQELL